ncbi:MAG TPA: nucleoside-diphosphate kinase [Planctomycetota bacterium]|nr:nucleoside-diphosphate kinase [Planctomycetota bacterium]
MERSLIILKPDCVKRGLIGQIIARFEAKGLKIIGLRLKALSRQVVEKHYEEHAAKPFFRDLCDFMTQGPVCVLAIEGPHAIAVARKLVGKTAGFEAEPGTIRGDFGLSNQSNLIHASDSPTSAARELELFFEPSELVSHKLPAETWW